MLVGVILTTADPRNSAVVPSRSREDSSKLKAKKLIKIQIDQNVEQNVVIGVFRHAESKSGPLIGFWPFFVQIRVGFCQFSVKRKVFE